ncbi:DsrE family protein [Haloarcula sp. JP-L23]|uniref:DsrE family protein n=1 Tax=Haloarcula sp. JP-L23 TaxID=2716717 RepID=UPI00140EECDA|nr:hypothetical protein G9465_13895 [Haloarcula sp. JP-L23]
MPANPTAPATDGGVERLGTIVHVPEGDSTYGKRAFRNVENLLADETLASDVTVVCNGGGVDHLLRSASTATRVRTLVERGVDVCACRNSLDSGGHDADELVDGVRIVPTAMGELTKQQASGSAYIRP